MTQHLTFTGFLSALLAALFIVASLYAMGRIFLGAFRMDRFGHHAALGVGFGLNHLAFLVFSLFMDGPAAVLAMNIIHGLLLVAFVYYARPSPSLKGLVPDPFPAVVLLVVFIPYLFGLSSPSMNVDTLNYYMPNIEWVYHRGLEFNPRLTAYSTMPMGAEYMFAQSFGLGGSPAVALTDAVFCLLTLRLAYGTARMVMPPLWASVFVGSILLIPQSFTYLFGSGKVDVVNAYLIFTAVSLVLSPLDPSRMIVVVGLLSASCAVKHLSWLQLVLPVLACILYLWKKRERHLLAAAFLIPVLFISPVIVKNILQVGNPLAPLIWTPLQHTFVAIHAGIGWEGVMKKLSPEAGAGKSVNLIAVWLFASVGFLLYFIAAILVPVAVSQRVDLGRFRPVFLFLLLALLPWHAYMGVSLQPTRFTLSFLMVLVLVIVYLVMRISERVLPSHGNVVGVSLALGLLLLNILNSFAMHGDLIGRYRDAGAASLVDWYDADGKNHYSISRRMAEEGWVDRNVMYLSPLVLGLIPYEDMGKAPTDREIHINRRFFQKKVMDHEYIFCSQGDVEKFGLKDRKVVLQEGYYLLLKR